MAWVFVWIALSVLSGIVAANKGRSAIGFFALSILLSPLVGLIAAFAVADNSAERGRIKPEEEQTTSVSGAVTDEMMDKLAQRIEQHKQSKS